MPRNSFIFKFQVLVLCFFFLTSCNPSANILKNLSAKTSDEAMYEDALKLVDTQDYAGAISKILATTASFQTNTTVKQTLAGAYAGKCGLVFLTFVKNLSGATGAPLSFLMSAFTSVTVSPSDCYLAQTTTESTFGSTSSARGTDTNFFLAVLGMVKIGTYLRASADTNQDGVVDTVATVPSLSADYDSCNSSSISDANVIQVGTGLGLILDNLAAISSSLSGTSSTGFATLQTACALITPNPCTITDPNSANWTATTIKAIRSVIKSNTFGIESCALGLLCCP